MRPRIVIVDDDPSFLATVRLLLETEGFVVVGEALNGLDGVAAVRELDPDIVLVDVTLPDIDGFQVVERLADGGHAAPVVLTSIRSAADFGDLVETSPAHAFITKAELSGEALAAILDGASSSA
jgi:DNA-binding NarL/FixJ family response regulator